MHATSIQSKVLPMVIVKSSVVQGNFGKPLVSVPGWWWYSAPPLITRGCGVNPKLITAADSERGVPSLCHPSYSSAYINLKAIVIRPGVPRDNSRGEWHYSSQNHLVQVKSPDGWSLLKIGSVTHILPGWELPWWEFWGTVEYKTAKVKR